MLSDTRRSLLVIVLLLLGVGLTWGQKWVQAERLSTDWPVSEQQAEDREAPEDGPSPTPAPEFTYFLDVEGWYRTTRYETVTRSYYDLSALTNEEMAVAIPAVIGEWQQVGEDEFVGDDPGVIFYLGHPTVALQRTYRDPSGLELVFAIVGNSGDESYLLFSHTPETCYPGRLWQVIQKRLESALLDDRPMHAQYLLTEHAQTGQRLMVLFWYLWGDPQRDPNDGVLSMRVNLVVPPDQTDEEILSRAWDFVRVLFPVTLPWERF